MNGKGHRRTNHTFKHLLHQFQSRYKITSRKRAHDSEYKTINRHKDRHRDTETDTETQREREGGREGGRDRQRRNKIEGETKMDNSFTPV